MLSIIAAMGTNRAIGLDNQMPWRLPADLRHFKQVTMAKPIVMGRKTFDSIGKPLPGRRNIVVSRQLNLQIPGCEVFASIEAVLENLGDAEEVMVMGGATLYQQCLPLCSRLYLTLIDYAFEADTYFPEWNAGEWKQVSAEPHLGDAENPFAYAFVVLERI